MPVPQVFSYDSFAGGLNTSVPARDVADNELVEALNVELDQRVGIRARNGLSLLADELDGPVSSVFHYRTSAGAETVVFTAGEKIYRMPVGGGSVVDLTGSLTLPTDGVWQWAVLENKAVGVNRGTGSNDNPVVIDSPSATEATALGGSVPQSRYVEAFDSRLWFVDEDEPNRLHFTALGDITDVTTPGAAGGGSINVGGNEGDHITGLKSHRGRLFIFKRHRTYALIPGSPTTDNRQWTTPEFSNRVGCVNGYSIQTVFNDIVFLSDHGLVSLQAVSQTGDFQSALLSIRIPELHEECNKEATVMASVNHATKLQYWIATAEQGQSTPNTTWVMDYTQLAAGGYPSWVKFNGGVVGTAYGVVFEDGEPVVYVGNAAGLYRYGDANVFADDSEPYVKILRTKAYSPGPSLWRKEFFRYGFEFEVETDDAELSLTYRFDEDDTRAKTVPLVFGSAFTGGRWGEGLWGTATWASATATAVDFMSAIRGTAGRRGQTIQFRLYNDRADGIRIRRLVLDASVLSRIHAGDLEL